MHCALNVTKLDRRPFYKCYLPPWDQFKGKTIGENKRRGGGWPSVSGTPLYVHKSQIQGQVKWAPLKGNPNVRPVEFEF